MKKSLVSQVAEKFNVNPMNDDSVKFSFGDDKYCLTDGTLYAVADDGSFLPGSKKVKGLLAVERFVSLRS